MKWVCCLFLGFLSACSGPRPDSPFRVVDSAGVRIAISDAPEWGDSPGWLIDPTPSLSIGIEDGDPRYTLDRVRWPSRLSDGRIVVPNTRSGIVKVYSPTGEYLTEFGGEGKGPGEFQFLIHISSGPGDTIRLYDAMLNRVTMFTPEGELVRTVSIEATGFYYGILLGWFADGSFGLTKNMGRGVEPNHGDRRDSFALEWHGPDGSVIGEYGVEVGNRRFSMSDGSSRVHPFTPRFLTAATSDVVAVGDGYGAQVRLLDPRGTLVGMTRWGHPTAPLTDEEFRDFERRVRDLFPEERLPVFLRALTEAPEPRKLPTYAGMLWDELGNLWIRQYDWMSDSNWIGRSYLSSTGPGDWWVFDNGGKWLGTVEVPDSLDLTQVGLDYVLGVQRDGLDVERVRVHALTR